MSRLRARLRSEDGFSLVELLAAMSVGGVVLWALMTIFVNSVQGSLRVTDRVEATQAARLAMDRITTVLNSQACISASRPPLVAGDSNQVTVYADLGDATFTPKQYRFTYDPSAKRITEEAWDGTGVPPTITYSGSPTSSRVLATNVLPLMSGGTAQPVFRYFRFPASGPINTETDTPLPVPVAAADLMKSVRIAVQFEVVPSRGGVDSPRATTVHGEGSVASADPSDPLSGARCL